MWSYYETMKLQRCLWGHFLLDHCCSCSLSLGIISFPSETPIEKSKFSFESSFQPSCLGMGHESIFPFSSRTSFGAHTLHFPSVSASSYMHSSCYVGDLFSLHPSSSCSVHYFFLLSAGFNGHQDEIFWKICLWGMTIQRSFNLWITSGSGTVFVPICWRRKHLWW